MVCGCILELQSVAYCLWVTVTLTSGHCSRKIFSEAYLPMIFEEGIHNLICGYILGSWSAAYCFWVTVTVTSGLSSRKIIKKGLFSVSNNFPQMCHILDPFLLRAFIT